MLGDLKNVSCSTEILYVCAINVLMDFDLFELVFTLGKGLLDV